MSDEKRCDNCGWEIGTDDVPRGYRGALCYGEPWCSEEAKTLDSQAAHFRARLHDAEGRHRAEIDAARREGTSDAWYAAAFLADGLRETGDVGAVAEICRRNAAALTGAAGRALVAERDQLRAALESVSVGLGDRLLAKGSLSESYAHDVMRQIRAALTPPRPNRPTTGTEK